MKPIDQRPALALRDAPMQRYLQELRRQRALRDWDIWSACWIGLSYTGAGLLGFILGVAFTVWRLTSRGLL